MEALNTAVTPKLDFMLICDDIRQEMGGKTSLMGMYDKHIVAPQLPFAFPKVCFYTRFSRVMGEYQFSFTIVSPSQERKTIIEKATVTIPSNATEGTFNVIAAPFEAMDEGEYEVVVVLEKDGEALEYATKFMISNGQRLQQEYHAMLAQASRAAAEESEAVEAVAESTEN